MKIPWFSSQLTNAGHVFRSAVYITSRWLLMCSSVLDFLESTCGFDVNYAIRGTSLNTRKIILSKTLQPTPSPLLSLQPNQFKSSTTVENKGENVLWCPAFCLERLDLSVIYRVSQKTCLPFEWLLWRSHESNFPVNQIYEQKRVQLRVWHRVWVNLTSSCWFMEQESQIYWWPQNQRIWCSPSMLKTKKLSVKMSLA